jgi:sugar lactone lactonase YvrE
MIYQTFYFHLDPKWKSDGITVAGGNGHGDQLNQLSHPHCMCIDDDQTIYVGDHENDRIVEWKCNASNGQIVAGGNGNGDQMNQFNYPSNVIIDKETNTFIIGDWQNKRVMRWSRQNNTTHGEVIISDIECWGLAMDKNGSLYICDAEKNEVRRLKRGDRDAGTIVAGGNGKGDQLNQFDWPTSIFIDDNYSLYICDCYNHRVMKWVKDAHEGIVVAGGNGQGGSLSQFSKPQGIIVDQFGRIYIADTYNHRVMCWYEGATEGTIVVGGNRKGRQSTQFQGPTDLSFDRQGNLYVVDRRNNRIQKFEINYDE